MKHVHAVTKSGNSRRDRRVSKRKYNKKNNAPDFNTTATAIDANNIPAIVSPGSA